MTASYTIRDAVETDVSEDASARFIFSESIMRIVKAVVEKAGILPVVNGACGYCGL